MISPLRRETVITCPECKIMLMFACRDINPGDVLLDPDNFVRLHKDLDLGHESNPVCPECQMPYVRLLPTISIHTEYGWLPNITT